MSKLKTENLDVLEKYWDSLIDSIEFQGKLLQSIDNKLGNTGLVNIDKFYSLTEMSKMVKLSKYHLKKDILSGKLKPLKRGGKAVFNKESIDNYLND